VSGRRTGRTIELVSDDPEPREAEIVPAWRAGTDPPITRQRSWQHPLPHAEVYLDGTWCPATLAQRQDRANGQTVYGLWVTLPGTTSAVYRTVRWHPGSLRPRS
jgi:hypothetical protein